VTPADFAAMFGFGIFLGLLVSLGAVILYKPRRQTIPNSTLVYCVARFSCGCISTNGRLTVCQAHKLLEEVRA
jgi:hypothetical protein